MNAHLRGRTGSRHRVHVIHWNAEELHERVACVAAAGYDVAHAAPSPTMLRDLKRRPPDAVIIDLSRLPAQGRDVAVALRHAKATRHVPLVFVDGDPAKVAKIRSLVPDAVYTTWSRIRSALERAITHPPTEPVTFGSTFAAYAGVSLNRKLGIKRNSVVALVSAPPSFAGLLDPLPPDVKLHHRLTGRPTLTVWFTRSQKELKKRIGTMAQHAKKGGLWIVWPKKSSSLTSDLTQAIVRHVGMAAGLVDFKVSAIDSTWTGLRFTQRDTES